DMKDVRPPPSWCERFECRPQLRSCDASILMASWMYFLRIDCIAAMSSREVNLTQRPACVCLPTLEDVLRVLEQRALEERERARVFQRDDDGYVLCLVGEAGLAPTSSLQSGHSRAQFPERVCFFLPLVRVRYFHVPPDAGNLNRALQHVLRLTSPAVH